MSLTNIGLGSRDNPIIIVTSPSCRRENASRFQIVSEPHSSTSICHDVIHQTSSNYLHKTSCDKQSTGIQYDNFPCKLALSSIVHENDDPIVSTAGSVVQEYSNPLDLVGGDMACSNSYSGSNQIPQANHPSKGLFGDKPQFKTGKYQGKPVKSVPGATALVICLKQANQADKISHPSQIRYIGKK